VTPWTGLTAYDYENKYDLPKIAVRFKKNLPDFIMTKTQIHNS
jgi:hypothetical protein